MGVLNVTPDSFSDGGRFLDADRALAHAAAMREAGADLIDVGAESTRPGAEPVPDHEQIRRLEPVLRGLCQSTAAMTSIDTSRSSVAAMAIEAGAGLVNDTSAGRDDPGMFGLCVKARVPIVLMHKPAKAPVGWSEPDYGDVVSEVMAFLAERRAAAVAAGIAGHRIVLDVGIGFGSFGKTAEQNLALLGSLRKVADLGSPVLVGVSRKAFIGGVTGEPLAGGRPFGTAAAVAWSVANGAAIVRVHDVEPMVAVVRMVRAILTCKAGGQ
jgi:dihydropteroate synthase